MGRIYRKNKEGLYQVESTVSDEILHDKEWLTEDEMKAQLVTDRFWKFVEESIKVDMEFPDGYRVNDKINDYTKTVAYNEWWLKNRKVDNFDELQIERFDALLKRLDLGITLGKSENNLWRVGFHYFYSDSHPRTHEELVRGTKEEALDYLINTVIPSQPDWMQTQIDLDMKSNSRTKIFISEVEVKELG